MKVEIFSPKMPLPEHREALAEVLDAYNGQHFPDPMQTVAMLIKEPDSRKIVGGLWGSLYWKWLFIEQFVIPPLYRGQGLGTSLLQQAENIALQRGCMGVWLFTFSFQAPQFYRKRGYSEFSQIADYPPGERCLYFCKTL